LTGRLAAFFGLSLQILMIVFLSRAIIDIGTRMSYPFIPQFAEGLGVGIVGFSWLLFVRSLTGLAGPLFGVLADQYGRRRLMAIGLILQAIGVLGLASAQGWWSVIPIIFYGLALAAYLPAQQAYISDQVVYQRRGRALASIEFSWALTGIVALPIAGWLIYSFGWRAPLVILGSASLVFAVLVWLVLPTTDHTTAHQLDRREMQRVFIKREVLASLAVALCLFVGVGIFATIWSIWLSADFGLTAVGLGLVATAIGVAELIGSGTSSLFIDRLGKRRGSILGLLFTAGAFLILPLTQTALPLAVLGLLVLGIGVEFSVVSLIPLYSVQAPEARATVFSLVGVGVAIGAAIASPAAASLWQNVGLEAVCAVGVITLCTAAGLVWKYLREG
jgi:predicted MFS family arabinose efflux permease